MKASERHKLKHDKAAETMVGGMDWASRHLSAIVAVFVAAGVIVAGAFWIASTRRRAAELAAESFGKAQELANSAVAQKLQGKEAGADVDTVVRQFLQIASDNSSSDIAARSYLAAGQILMRTGSPEEALPHFEKAAGFDNLPGLQALARRGMAEALEAMGKPEQAIEQYMTATASPFAPEAIHACWDIGRCYEQLKDREKAEEFYKRAAEHGGDSEWASLAAFRLAELAGGAELLGPVADLTAAVTSLAPATPAPGPTTTMAAPLAPVAPEGPVAAPPVTEQPAPSAPVEDAPAPKPEAEAPAQP